MTFSSSKFPTLDTEGFDRLGGSDFTEPRTICVGAKLRRGTAAALAKAVEAQARTRASLIETAIEQWLRGNGFLK